MKLIAYYRVSTDKQERSGLGLEAQKSCVDRYSGQYHGRLIRAYTEVESGRRNDRRELAKAIADAKREGARLVVAKLDRLSRNCGFMCRLCETGLDFVACDNPGINSLTIKILAAVAEEEAKLISERTRSAMQAYKARGGKLGGQLPQCRNLDRAARKRGTARSVTVRADQADQAYSDLYPLVVKLRKEGRSLSQIAGHLNGRGYATRQGAEWNKVQVQRLLCRADRLGIN